MTYIVLILIAIVMAIIAFGSFCIALAEKKEQRETEAKLQRKEENAKKTAETITHANEQKESLSTGNNNVDFNNGVALLHQYSTNGRKHNKSKGTRPN